ncbi:LIM and calponin homology domains-containing protein 1a isoform X9 [Ctenopharyngodon idella]|uniref:LIM and calponin homology domains-containing protein 1a isoform X9 n=1 Tax=Ctenopharyngodon idella TaxID=7959 RepID=UPI00222EAC4D|nr:LIM and calponin homology domains-containing protein 1a isoform X9 [Ctenopharyngodon idella]
MASPGNDSASNAQLDQGESADATPEPAFQEAQKWIEAVTGRSFGDKDFRSGLENGILLCELLSSIKPGLVKKINRLPTPIAGLDNLTMFLRGCEELGLKGSQLFDPGDLQDTSIRANLTGSDCSRKLKNVLITIYWLGKAANSCATYNGPTLDLKEFEGLLSMMRKECVNEELDSPKRSIRDSGYIDSWESERSDSLSPPRHAREDSFDSLDSFGSRSQNTPSPDTVIRCNSDDSEGDGGHRKLPDVRKDDMSARRVSYKEPRAALPFNQYLPNKSNQTNYLPAPLRKRRSEREEDRRSLSNSTSPVGERPLRSVSLIDMRDEEDELAYLRAHSQSRHEHLHNQYNKLKEEEDQWQDDLARWKSRRRSASQDLIKKEEERKMMEKLMTTDGGSGHRRKSIKTYKEIVEEKERREQELHEQYCKASTPEEKAAVLQRYALRFTISDAILEKLQLPKLPSAASPMHTSPLHQPEKKPTCTALVEAKVPEPAQTTQTHHSIHVDQKTAEIQAPAQPKTPEPSPAKSIKAPEVLSAPTRVPPAPSKPVPLIAPKPYSQPKFSQGLRKSLKSDGLIRVNGESTQQESRERDDRDSVHRPINFSPSPPKPATQSQQNEELIVLEASDHQQNLQTSVPEQEKEVVKMEKECSLIPQEEDIKEDTSTALLVSEPAGKQPVPDTTTKLNCVVTTTIVTELTQTHQIPPNDTSCTEQLGSVHNSCDLSSTAETITADQTSYSLSLSGSSSSSRLRWEFFAPTEGIDYSIECIETPMLNLAKRVDHWTWDPNEERRRQERWQQEQERLLQEKYQREQEKLKEEWERAQREVEEEERRHHEEERRILEETVTPLTPRTSVLSSSSVTEAPSLTQPSAPHDTIVLSLADWDKKQEMLEKQAETNQSNSVTNSPEQVITPAQQNGQRTEPQESQTATPQLQFIQDGSWSCKSKGRQEDLKKTASLDRKQSPPQSQTTGMRRTGSCENVLGTHPSKSPTPSQDTPPPSPSRSVSGKKLCSSCAHPLGKGAAMIIETLGLYFHIQCFKCGVCKGLLGDTSAGTDVRIRNGLLNCQECYIKSRAAGQPTTL